MRDKRDRAITCVFCHDLHLTLMFPGLNEMICLKESEVWQRDISNKIIVMLSHKVCRLLSSPVLLRKFTIIWLKRYRFFEICYLNIPCLRMIIILIFMNSPICRKNQRQMFLFVSGGHSCAPQRDTNMASQHAKKVVSDSPGVVHSAIGQVNSVFNLPDGQVIFFQEFK